MSGAFGHFGGVLLTEPEPGDQRSGARPSQEVAEAQRLFNVEVQPLAAPMNGQARAVNPQMKRADLPCHARGIARAAADDTH